MQDEMDKVLEDAFQYFKSIRVLKTIKSTLKSINPSVHVYYDAELESIMIDHWFSCYIPTNDDDTYAICKQMHDPGTYYDPPSYDEKELYSTKDELGFYHVLVKNYLNELEIEANMVLNEELDYLAETEYLKKITG